jgi:uncharacterized protein with von Willebrand factor type A (vWA) domain
MFSGFFYFLRDKGLKVSLGEWLTLIEALDKGLCNSSLTDFYYISKMILVKSETEFDKFDMIFNEYFKGIKGDTDDITDRMLRWLDKTDMADLYTAEMEEKRNYLNQIEEHMNADKTKEAYQEKKKQQDSEHNGGATWIGTMGKTSFGNMGGNLGGIRIGGTTGYQSAFEVIGERKFRDFRNDRILDNRQFQVALRRLRQFSTRLDIPKDEFDLEQTINATCNNGGYLKIVFDRPRKNTVKLLLLMDSGGTMIPYCDLLNELFQSVNKSNHYKDVKTYYFHNCIYSHVYKSPECENGDWVETDWLFRNLDNNYKVIIVGDAAMAPEELYSDTGNYRGPNNGLSGLKWLHLMKRHYKKIVWLNPKMAPGNAPWREAETVIRGLLPMYKLSVDGLKSAMSQLMM